MVEKTDFRTNSENCKPSKINIDISTINQENRSIFEVFTWYGFRTFTSRFRTLTHVFRTLTYDFRTLIYSFPAILYDFRTVKIVQKEVRGQRYIQII